MHNTLQVRAQSCAVAPMLANPVATMPGRYYARSGLLVHCFRLWGWHKLHPLRRAPQRVARSHTIALQIKGSSIPRTEHASPCLIRRVHLDGSCHESVGVK